MGEKIRRAEYHLHKVGGQGKGKRSEYLKDSVHDEK